MFNCHRNIKFMLIELINIGDISSEEFISEERKTDRKGL